MTPEAFKQTTWLSAVGEPPPDGVGHMGSLSDMRAALDRDPDTFYAPPYASPYEGWCVADHEAARAAPAEAQISAVGAAADAYDVALELFGQPELAGLVSDDVSTILTLLSAGTELSPFTRERAGWIAKGRFPWGYEGDFPNGRWRLL